MPFPTTRLRRLRMKPSLRRGLQETDVSLHRLVMPLFIRPGQNEQRPISSMPGQFQWSVDRVVKEVGALRKLGLDKVLLFGIPEKKDPAGRDAYSDQGIVQKAVRALKKAYPDLFVITDLCFCEYTSHGHCGILKKGILDNDETLRIIGKAAVVQARAGSDMIAPSGMIDGMVRQIRISLDGAGFSSVPIMSYAAKFASAFYGPFRDAAGSAPQFGDRHSYQMNPANADEAMREVGLDIEEGADIVMVKPALAYLDMIRRVKEQYNVPVAAYNVSGEYAMVKAAAAHGWINGAMIVQEILTGIRRAGADLILTYHAKEWADALRASSR